MRMLLAIVLMLFIVISFNVLARAAFVTPDLVQGVLK